MIKSYLSIGISVFIVFAVTIGLSASLMAVDTKSKIMMLDISFVLFTGSFIRMRWLQLKKD